MNGDGPGLIHEDLRASIRHILGLAYDKMMMDILAQVIIEEPVSLYRITRKTPYSISSIYKKAKQMLHKGLIKPTYNGNLVNRDARKRIYEASVKGILACLSYRCLDDGLLLSKIGNKWGLRTFCRERIVYILKAITEVVEPSELHVIEDSRLLMVKMLSTILQKPRLVNGDPAIREAYNVAFYFLLNRLLVENLLINDDEFIVINKSFIICINHKTRDLKVYLCSLCSKHCFFTHDGSIGCRLHEVFSRNWPLHALSLRPPGR